MNPLDLVKQDALSCVWDAPRYLFFSAEVDSLVYYSHIFPTIAILILATVILIGHRKLLTSSIFTAIAILFALYTFVDLIVWASVDPSIIMFMWSLLIYIEPMIYAAVLYLVLVFITRRDVSIWHKIGTGLLLSPVILFGPTSLNLAGFNYTDCWRLAEEGLLSPIMYFVEFIFVTWIIVESTIYYKKETNRQVRRKIALICSGSLLLLLSLSSGNIFGTLLQDVMGEEAWIIGQYGLFGMPIFLGFILYLIVQFKAFNIKLIATEALTIALGILLFSLLLINNLEVIQVVILITFILFVVLGFLLIRSVRKEIQQRERIEELAGKLEKANKRLKVLDQIKSEFVSIASHQLRSPLTSIRGYASMLLEGSFGKLTTKGREAVERINESSRYMALSVEDYLNVSRIEAGRMKYEISDFNLKDLVERIVDDVRPTALKRGLVLTSKTSPLEGQGRVKGDIGKTQQIIHNLIDNAIKYTPKGSIKVQMRDSKSKVFVDVIDTGVGMNKDSISDVFEKFVRARNANKVNVTGTGLGLFVARQMAAGMKGAICVSSDGEGKGSTFTLELPISK